MEVGQGVIHRREVARHHLGPLAGIALLDALLDKRDRLVPRQDTGQGEEAGLHDGVDAIAHAVALGDPIAVDAIELDVEGADAGAQPLGQLGPDPVGLMGSIEQQGRPSAANSSRSTDSTKPHWWQPIKLACSISQGRRWARGRSASGRRCASPTLES